MFMGMRVHTSVYVYLCMRERVHAYVFLCVGAPMHTCVHVSEKTKQMTHTLTAPP